jgi:hypothetical protein
VRQSRMERGGVLGAVNFKFPLRGCCQMELTADRRSYVKYGLDYWRLCNPIYFSVWLAVENDRLGKCCYGKVNK